VAKLSVYKKGQGRYARTITFVAVMVVGFVGAWVLSSKLAGYPATEAPIFRYGIPTAVMVVLGLLMFWMVNRPKSADFLIATEGEMKKVSWSSRKEIVGSTKVVIVAVFMMAGILYGVDAGFALLFRWLGVMGG
jgi:preprotein translocase subunit SecE